MLRGRQTCSILTRLPLKSKSRVSRRFIICPATMEDENLRQEPAQELDIRQIMAILPHRYPFLLIDRVVELSSKKRIVAIKNVTINEPFFQGHFPEYAIMP